MSAKAGRLQIQLELEVAALRRDLDSVNKQLTAQTNAWKKSVDGFSKSVKDAFKFVGITAALSALGGAVSHTIDEMGRITDESVKIGDSAENFQRLEYAATQVGVSMEDVTKAIGRMEKGLGEMEQGGAKKAADAMERLGINIEEFRKLKPADQFIKLGGALGQMKDFSEQAAVGSALFGKGWQTLLPLLKQGEEQIRATADAAVVASDKAVKAGDDFGDAMDTMKRGVTALIAEGLAPVLPYLTAFVEQGNKAGAEAKEAGGNFDSLAAITENLAKWFNGLVLSVKLAGQVLVTFGRVLGTIGAAAVEVIGGIAESFTDLFNPSKIFSGQAAADLERRLKVLGLNVGGAFKDIQIDATNNFKNILDSAEGTLSRIQRVGQNLPDFSGVKGRGPGDAADPAEAAAEAARKATAALKASADARKAETEALKAQQQAQKDLQDEVTKESEQRDALNNVLEQQATQRKRAEDLARGEIKTYEDTHAGLSGYALDLQLAQEELAKQTEANDKLENELKAQAEAWINLQVAMMRARGESEETIKAWEQQARKLSDVQIQTEKMQGDAEKMEADTQKRRESSMAWASFVEGSINEIFGAMTEGSKEAEQAIIRLIAQLLQAILTAKILEGISSVTGMKFQKAGGAWSGGVQLFAQGGIVSSPTAFSFAGNRMGVMGESGPEAIMPLKRGVDGKLGVAGGANVQVFNYAGANISVQNDQDKLRIIVDQVRSGIAADIARGGNPVSSALERAYSVRR